MILRTKRSLSQVALSGVVLLRSPDCPGRSKEVVQHFELRSCPDTAFMLPASAEEPPFRLSPAPGKVVSADVAPRCPGFKSYWMFANGEGQAPFRMAGVDVRLNRGPTCSVDVVYVQAVSDSSGRYTRGAEAIARLMLHGSGVMPIIPAASTIELESIGDVRDWCSRTTASAAAPCDRVLPAETPASVSPMK
jgi:hypothetical protein